MTRFNTNLLEVIYVESNDDTLDFQVKVLETNESFLVGYDSIRNIICSIAMENQIVFKDKDNISSVTGRKVSDCHKDLDGAMEFYLLEILKFMTKFLY